MLKNLLFLALLGVFACSGQSATGPMMPNTGTVGSGYQSEQMPNFLEGQQPTMYVADADSHTLFAYHLGAPTSFRSVQLDGTPRSVATDSKGNVYVSVPYQDEVVKYDSGLNHKLNTLRASDDIDAPFGIAVDSEDNLWVVHSPNVINEYVDGKTESQFAYHVPGYARAIAVNGKDQIFVSSQMQGGGLVVRADSVRGFTPITPTNFPGGMVFDRQGNLIADNFPFVTTYTVNTWKVKSQIFLGKDTFGGYLAIDREGTLYLPVRPNVQNPKNYLWILPTSGANAQRKISEANPIGVAIGY